jgi:hypothetical protein
LLIAKPSSGVVVCNAKAYLFSGNMVVKVNIFYLGVEAKVALILGF